MACHNLKCWCCFGLQPQYGVRPGPFILVPLLFSFLGLQSPLLLHAHLTSPYSAQIPAFLAFTPPLITLGFAVSALATGVEQDAAIQDSQDFIAAGALLCSRQGSIQRSSTPHPSWCFTLSAWRSLSRIASLCCASCIAVDWALPCVCVDAPIAFSAPVSLSLEPAHPCRELRSLLPEFPTSTFEPSIFDALPLSGDAVRTLPRRLVTCT
eukprot:2223939-Rhodomonas_salina.2